MACSNHQTSQIRAVVEMGFGWLCVDVVVYVYRMIYFCLFDILRKWGLSMSRFVRHSLRNQNKNKKKFAADAVGW